MTYPTVADLDVAATMFGDLVAGRCSRAQATRWAEDVRETHATVHPGAISFGSGSDEFKWAWAVLASAELDEATSGTGPPYFFRDGDLEEWQARCRHVASPPLTGPLGPIRLHETDARFGLPVADVDCADTLSRGVGPAVRGVDGLGYCEEYLLASSWGTTYYLVRHWPEGATRPFVLYVENGEADVQSAMERLLTALGLPSSAVSWISPEAPPSPRDAGAG